MIDIFSRKTIKSRIDELLINEYDHLKTNHRLKLHPSKKDHLPNCGTTDNNNLIMKYINSIYDEYDIPNPLQSAPKEKRI